MKNIPLTKGQFVIVDDHWYDFLMQWKWRATWNEPTKSFYAVRTQRKKNVLMHRVVAQTPDGMICDHRHHNTLDNREEELRNVTRSQSQANRGLNRKNKVGVTGVSQHPNCKGYRAILDFEGKTVLDKSFPKFEDAVAARQEAEKKYFGEFAYAGDK